MSRLFSTAASRLLAATKLNASSAISHQINRGLSSAFLPINRLAPSPPQLLRPQPLFAAQTAGMKYVPRPTKRCRDCFMYIKDEITYVDCKTHPRHKQATKRHLPRKVAKKVEVIMTHATQGGNRRGNGRGHREMWTQQGLRMEF